MTRSLLFATLWPASSGRQAPGIGAVFAPRLLRVGVVAGAFIVAACVAGETEMEQAVLFSALEGQVMQNGQPLANATLVREWDFPENKVRGRDEATTDANGQFRLPVVLHPYRRSRFFPQQPVVVQLIRVSHGGTEWRVWAATKMNLKAGTEISSDVIDGTAPDQPLKVVMDLDLPQARRGMIVGHTLFKQP